MAVSTWEGDRMARLEQSLVQRRGVTSTYYTYERDAKITAVGYRPSNHRPSPGIKLGTSIASKGGGVTCVDLFIDRADFLAIVLEMFSADKRATMKAFANAFLKHA
ncbi:hypothetical protein [Phyllobacterium phragmitis]|uniref:hypothetical protein n=1 Tax=Phyllobacterium phragmitis TaxID=2670329 RepID=UPI0011B1FAAA|nr:hypothetical protein [Phyllobacterium phragmitis]